MTRSKKIDSLSRQKDLENEKNENIIDNLGFKEKYENILKEKILYLQIISTKDELLAAKDTIICELNEKNILLKEKIKCLTENQKNHEDIKSYSEILRETVSEEQKVNFNTNAGNSTTTLMIKPTNIQNSKKTKQDLGKFINPSTLDVNIKKINDLENGSIKIQCKTNEEVDKLKKEVESKLGQTYKIQSQEMRGPRLKVIGIEEEFKYDELKKVILDQNKEIENANLKIIVLKKMKTKYMAIIEIDGENYKKTINKGMLFINFTICPVFEYFDVHRCYKCSGYNHSAKFCSKSQICMKCGKSDHEVNNCLTTKENIQCPNCIDVNKKFDLGYFINHSPFDINCQVYKNQIKKNKLKINYNSE